jgi:hypothetical protein
MFCSLCIEDFVCNVRLYPLTQSFMHQIQCSSLCPINELKVWKKGNSCVTLKIKLKSCGLAKKCNWFEVEWKLAAHVFWDWREVESVYHYKVISLLFSWAFCQGSEIVFWHHWPLYKCYSGLCQLYLYGRQILALILCEVCLLYKVDEKYNVTWCSCLMVFCLLPDGFLQCHFPMQRLCLRFSTMVWLCTACYIFDV